MVATESRHPYLTTTEAGARAGISASRVHQLVKAGELPARRLRRRVFVEREALERWVNERREVFGE